jgi:5-methylcytosine-specific restriction protein B
MYRTRLGPVSSVVPFAFVELDPRRPPVQGLLGRWLERHGLPLDAALLLDELNRRIADSDAAIGPSYLMDRRIYAREDGLSRVWQYSIMLLLEDLFYGQADLDQHYGLPSLRKAITAPPAEP